MANEDGRSDENMKDVMTERRNMKYGINEYNEERAMK